jgi:predicted ATP-dependent endonuclease of OLD family
MRLTRVTISNYRCINDSEPVEIGDVTCLVGKNESGKTAFLEALRKLNPTDGSAQFNDVMDYPAKGFARYKRIRVKEPAEVVNAVFTLDDDEAAQIEQDFGTGLLRSREITVTKGYDNKTYYGMSLDEAAAVRHLTAGLQLPEEQGQQVRQLTTISDLVDTLNEVAEPHSSVTALLSEIATWHESNLRKKVLDDHLAGWLPRFFYFDDYSILKGKVSIPELKRRRDANQLDDPDRTAIALLAMVGATLEDFEDQSNYERLKRELEAAANSITDEVFEFWSQNNQLAVTLDIAAAEPTAPAPLNEGPILHIRIHNQRHRATVPFDERSRGFVWFFSFLAYFSQLQDGTDDREVALLLDEPGLNLHATAQGDLLRFIDERLAPDHQVIYTTHSPFMIQPDRLNRVRTVQDVDNEGTKISAEVFRTDAETVFPLQAALGYELAQTLFVGPDNLLVEGPSDILYIQLLNQALAGRGKPTLNDRWVKVPVGGADKLSTFVSLLGSNRLNVAVLMDISGNSIQRIRNLQANDKLGANALVQISEVTANEADIEDLFEPSFYLKLVNGAYRKQLGRRKLTLSALPKGSPRIVRRLEQHFKDKAINGGKFNHYLPAAYFLSKQGTLLQDLDDVTLDRAEKLFARINGLISPPPR